MADLDLKAHRHVVLKILKTLVRVKPPWNNPGRVVKLTATLLLQSERASPSQHSPHSIYQYDMP